MPVTFLVQPWHFNDAEPGGDGGKPTIEFRTPSDFNQSMIITAYRPARIFFRRFAMPRTSEPKTLLWKNHSQVAEGMQGWEHTEGINTGIVVVCVWMFAALAR